MANWQDEWPKEKGFFWFYGWRFGKEGVGSKERKPELCMVEVCGTAVKGQFVYVTHGHFLFEEEAEGKWLQAVVPDLPDVSKEVIRNGHSH